MASEKDIIQRITQETDIKKQELLVLIKNKQIELDTCEARMFEAVKQEAEYEIFGIGENRGSLFPEDRIDYSEENLQRIKNKIQADIDSLKIQIIQLEKECSRNIKREIEATKQQMSFNF